MTDKEQQWVTGGGMGLLGALVACLVGAAGFGLVFLGLARLLRIGQVNDLVAGLARRLRRG